MGVENKQKRVYKDILSRMKLKLRKQLNGGRKNKPALSENLYKNLAWMCVRSSANG